MEGFGSAEVTTPFHYGSVADGIRHNPSLEQKLKKKYWKTKQTVIQKFNKSQDEFVVAGDADIDTNLEVGVCFLTGVCACVCVSVCVSDQHFISSLAYFLSVDSLPPAVLLPPAAPRSRKVLLQTQRFIPHTHTLSPSV